MTSKDVDKGCKELFRGPGYDDNTSKNIFKTKRKKKRGREKLEAVEFIEDNMKNKSEIYL